MLILRHEDCISRVARLGFNSRSNMAACSKRRWGGMILKRKLKRQQIGQLFKQKSLQLIEGYIIAPKLSCRGRVRTSTEQLATTQTVVVNPGRSAAKRRNGSMLRLSCDLHPRDERVCLPLVRRCVSIDGQDFITPQCKTDYADFRISQIDAFSRNA